VIAKDRGLHCHRYWAVPEKMCMCRRTMMTLRIGSIKRGNTWKDAKSVILKILITIQGWSVLCLPGFQLQACCLEEG